MDKELLERKSMQVEHALTRIKSKLENDPKAFEQDFDSQDIVYRNFQIVLQNCVDMGSHVISMSNFPIPKTMGEVFDILVQQKVILPKMGKELRHMVTLRNIIVHDYARLDNEKAFLLIKKSLKIVPKFCITLIEK